VATVDLATQRRRPVAAAGKRIVYFDFDSFVIKDEYQGRWSRPRQALAANRGKRIVEGHTDERGGREYNLALGQKRAEAVLQVAGAAGRGRMPSWKP
jgi:peptidoglycan-associated lipoprotein